MNVWTRGLLDAGMIVAALTLSSAANAAVTISTGATSNMTCTSGVCTPTAKKAVLNVGDLTTMLGSGNVVVNTGAGLLAQQVKDIVVSASFNWANASSLTLDAYDSVTVNQPVAVNGTGAVVLTTNDGGTEGNLSFGSKGSLSFLGTSNSLTIDATPYTLVGSIASLASAIAANPSGSYALAHNYDASADGDYSTSPIPTALTGNVQGLGNTISKLTLKIRGKDSEVGLFTTFTGTVDNLRLTGLHVVGSPESNGGGGFAYDNQGQMFGDTVSGDFRGKCERCFWGGLVGANEGAITQSSAAVHIVGKGGGLVGENYHGTISLSQTSGEIDGTFIVGGLVGENEGAIDQSLSTMAVNGSSSDNDSAYAGGLIGLDEGSTSNSYATGAVTGGEITDVGGMDGKADGALTTSYSTGAVNAGSGSLVGGFVGYPDATWSDCYWDTTTSGTDNGTGGGNRTGLTGLTTAQLQSGLPAGFDPTIWAESPKINKGFPYLINNPPQ